MPATKTIASNESEKGSFASGRNSVVSAHTGLMFKCFDSIYGARRLMNSIEKRSMYSSSVKASIVVPGGVVHEDINGEMTDGNNKIKDFNEYMDADFQLGPN